MPNTVTQDTKTKSTTTAQDVIDFLRENPKFLNERPEAADLLIPARNRPKKGEIADFQSYMIERLKTDKNKVVESTRELVENARSNMTNQQRINTAVLRLLESNSFDDFIQTITMDLASILSVDISVLIVEADGNAIPDIQTSGIRVIPEGTVDLWMGSEHAIMQDNVSGLEAIYGGGAALVQSQILLRIDVSMGTPPAILAFGSRNPDMFNPTQATEQILFLAQVVERGLRLWLNLPQS